MLTCLTENGLALKDDPDLRGIPVILLVYLVGFGIPALDLSGLPTEPVVLGGIALALSYTAYVSEVYRAGLRWSPQS